MASSTMPQAGPSQSPPEVWSAWQKQGSTPSFPSWSFYRAMPHGVVRGCFQSRSHVTLSLNSYRGGGVRGGKFLPWDISQRVYFACSPEFAVGNFAPTCCEPTFGWWWLLLFADALQLSPRGLLFLPDELLDSALRPLNKGCNKQLRKCFRWLQLTSQDPQLQILTAHFSVSALVEGHNRLMLGQLLDKTFC